MLKSLLIIIRAASRENRTFANATTKAQISCTADQCLCFHYTDCTIPLLYILKHSSLILRLYRPDCVRPGRKSRSPVFLHCISYLLCETVKQLLCYSTLSKPECLSRQFVCQPGVSMVTQCNHLFSDMVWYYLCVRGLEQYCTKVHLKIIS